MRAMVRGGALLAGLAAAIMAVSPLRAQAPQAGAVAESYLWRPVAIGAGGFITGYDADPKGVTQVIRTDVYGAYLWIEPEKRWAQLVNAASMPQPDRKQNGAAEGVFEIRVAPSRPQRIYMVINGHVYRSDDRGASFARVSRSGPFPLMLDANSEFRQYGSFMAVSPANPDLVLLGTPDNGLLRSQDGGETWQVVDTLPRGAALRPGKKVKSPGVLVWFEPSQSGQAGQRVLAMSAGNGVFASQDGGASFSPLAAPGQPQPTTLKQGAFAPDGSFYGVDVESRTLWRLRGGVWTDLSRTSRIAAGRFAYVSVAVNPRNGQIFVFDEGGRAQRSGDGGEHWEELPKRSQAGEGDPPWLRVSNQSYFATGRVFFDPVTPDRLIIGAGTGVYYADMPANAREIVWTSRSRGIEELVTNDVVQPPGKAPLFAAWDFGIHVKDDLNAFSTTYGPRERVVIAAQQLDWSPSDPGFIVTNASDTRLTCCSGDGQSVLAGFSIDGGRHWSRFTTLPEPPGTSPIDPWRMSFGSIAVAADSVDNIIWAPSFNRSPFYTKDRGVSWRRVELPGEKLPNTGSHGSYWSQRKHLAADRVLPGVFYYYHSGEGENARLRGLWRTQDGGEHWTQVFRQEIAPQSRFTAKLRAVPGKAGHLFFTSAVANGPDVRLRRSINGGESWDVVPNVDHVDDVAFGKAAPGAAYPAIYVSGRVGGAYGIWRSTDNAASWRRLTEFPVGTLDQVTVIEADKDRFGRVYIGYKGSGWRYGEPASCTPAAYRFPQASECTAVR